MFIFVFIPYFILAILSKKCSQKSKKGWEKRCKGEDGHINGLPIEEGFKHSTYYVLQLKSSATYKKNI